jgi:hypothetical protein
VRRGLAALPALVVALGWGAARAAAPAGAKPWNVPSKVAAFKVVTFGDKKATVYADDGDAIKMRVEKSAAFLLMPFDRPRATRELRFQWKADGAIGVKDAATQRTKAGDDTLLRVGLVVAGEAPALPFMAPEWAKLVREQLRFSAGTMRFAVVGSPVPAGEAWKSPWTDDITLYAAEDEALAHGWHQARAVLPATVSAVGLWIMADGDDTGSSFTTWLRRLTLK